MIRLLLETATDVCSVAVAKGGLVLAEHTATEAHQHSSHLTLFIQKVMAEAELEMTDLDSLVPLYLTGRYTSVRQEERTQARLRAGQWSFGAAA